MTKPIKKVAIKEPKFVLVDVKTIKMSKFKIINPKVGELTEFMLASPATIDTYKPEIITQGKNEYQTTGVMSGNAMLVVKIN